MQGSDLMPPAHFRVEVKLNAAIEVVLARRARIYVPMSYSSRKASSGQLEPNASSVVPFALRAERALRPEGNSHQTEEARASRYEAAVGPGSLGESNTFMESDSGEGAKQPGLREQRYTARYPFA